MKPTMWCLSCCLSYSDEKETYFPDVTVEDQEEIYNRYKNVIKQEAIEKTHFEDSMIDVELARDMLDKIDKESSILLIDFGGSSLKFAVVNIKQNKETSELAFEFVVEKSFYFKDENEVYAENERLYNFTWNYWVSRKLKGFLQDKQMPKSAALTFSSRINQVAHDKAYFKLSSFKKDWWFKKNTNIDEEIDVVAALNQSLEEFEINFKVTCVLNDAIATYMTGLSLKMKNPISAIFGTGTNGGYTIPSFNSQEGERLINPEWANADISNLGFIDDVSKEFFRDGEKELCQVEVLTAGLRLSEIIRAKLITMGYSDEKTVQSLNNKAIYAIIDKDSNERTLIESIIHGSVSQFKRRGYKIIAPIILAASGSNKEFSVVTNGTFAGKEFDQEILNEELQAAKNNIDETKYKEIVEIRFVNNASLYGAAYTSLISQMNMTSE